MSNSFLKYDDFFEDEEAEVQSLSEFSEIAFEFDEASIDKSEILRIEESISVSWSGVTACCRQSVIDSKCNAKFEKWVENKLYEYRRLRYVRFGHAEANVACRRGRRGWPDNRRWCTGRTTLDCYIEFRKP